MTHMPERDGHSGQPPAHDSPGDRPESAASAHTGSGPAASAHTGSGPAAAGPARGTVVLAGIADVLCIFIFVFVGRRSHQEASALIGLATTAWPFLAGLAIAWAATRVWRGPLRLWPTAVLLWFLTVALGLGLRLLSGQGASGAFPLVAAAFLALVLIGWRLIARLALRRRT